MLMTKNFYNDFEDYEKGDKEDDDDEEEDDDDDDDYATLDDAAVADFRNRMANSFGMATSASDMIADAPSESNTDTSDVDELIQFARKKQQQEQAILTDWAKPAADDFLQEGLVLLANPAHFCSNFNQEQSTSKPSPALLSKYGLTLPPPAELGPDRQADLLPVLLLVQVATSSSSFATTRSSSSKLHRAVLLNRRTGYLLGDLEQSAVGDGTTEAAGTPLLAKFCIQPLWFGGIENDSMGLDMLHQCPVVDGAKQLSKDGLYWGGDPAEAQEAMADPSLERVLTGFDFKFFVQSTVWKPDDLQKEIDNGTWFVARVSKEVLFKSRDRTGTQRAKVRFQTKLVTHCVEVCITWDGTLDLHIYTFILAASLERMHGATGREV
jgi:hypothetical protein